jgi:AmmeMemoRadiSam system protein A
MIALTAEQERAIHRAAAEILASAVSRRLSEADPSLGGASEHQVLGAFVSLKRCARLRGCCGSFGAPTRLADAIGFAARRTATEDGRFPPVSPSELAYLDLEVWLLDDARPVECPAADRASAVVVGKHGLRIQRGRAAGLLLPGVAVENHLDAESFLEHVCLKAALPRTAWKDDDTRLMTFEGHAAAGPFDAQVASEARAASPAPVTGADLARLVEHCRANLCAAARGTVTSSYDLTCPDGTVQCASLAVRPAERAEPLRLFRLSLRPGIPLQATLYELVQAAAKLAIAEGLNPGSLLDARIDLTVSWDAAMHGTLLQPELDGIEPVRRAVLVADASQSACVFDPALSAKDLLTAAADAAGVCDPGAAWLFSLRTESTERRTVMIGASHAS